MVRCHRSSPPGCMCLLGGSTRTGSGDNRGEGVRGGKFELVEHRGVGVAGVVVCPRILETALTSMPPASSRVAAPWRSRAAGSGGGWPRYLHQQVELVE